MPTQGSAHFLFRITAEELLYGGNYLARAFAGKDDGDGIKEPGEGRGDPSAVGLKSIGPLPPGRYRIRGAEFHPKTKAWTMRLEPDAETRARIIALGRNPDSFLIHGDSVALPGSGSEGCIVTGRSTRMFVAGKVAVGEDSLDVVP